MMDWEMKAKHLAQDLRTAAFWLAAMSVWLWVEVDGWATVLPAIGVLAALGVLRDARIEP